MAESPPWIWIPGSATSAITTRDIDSQRLTESIEFLSQAGSFWTAWVDHIADEITATTIIQRI
jgi:hypothetical protein